MPNFNICGFLQENPNSHPHLWCPFPAVTGNYELAPLCLARMRGGKLHRIMPYSIRQSQLRRRWSTMVGAADENWWTQNLVVVFGCDPGTRLPDHPGSTPACRRGDLKAKTARGQRQSMSIPHRTVPLAKGMASFSSQAIMETPTRPWSKQTSV